MEDTESGYIGEINLNENLGNHITDVEILSESQTNVVARGRRHGRLWLLKGLSPELRDTASGRRRLMKEFVVHSRLCHPSVVQAVNLEEVEGLGECIVMEWVEGETLSDLLREGELSKHERRRIMRDIVVAVEYIHRNGVVHRDLKPSNIMVRRAGHEVVIIDFGLADTDNYVELKQSAGTHGFISPQQIENGGADTADDVYSLGVIMTQLCPMYHRLARICTGSYIKRPANAGELRKIMATRDKRRRIIFRGVLFTTLLILASVGLWHISILHKAARQSDAKVDSLIGENNRNAQYIALLSDSLSSVHSRMVNTQLELQQTKDYTRLYDENFQKGSSAIKARFDRFEKKCFSSTNKIDALTFNQNAQVMMQEQQQFIDQFYQNVLKSGLKENDATRLKGDIHNYFLTELDRKWQEWIKKTVPATI